MIVRQYVVQLTEGAPAGKAPLCTEPAGGPAQASRHLQLLTLQLFFTLIPVCADSLVTKLMAPVIALILMSLLKLSQEVEDPFGFDTHDLPWIQVLGTLTRCSLRDVDEQTKENVVLWFNHGARTG